MKRRKQEESGEFRETWMSRYSEKRGEGRDFVKGEKTERSDGNKAREDHSNSDRWKT
jgi:hypothetical protein